MMEFVLYDCSGHSTKHLALLPLSLGMLALRTQLPYCEEVQMGTPWTNPACYPAALLRAQPTGTPTTTHASEGVSR